MCFPSSAEGLGPGIKSPLSFWLSGLFVGCGGRIRTCDLQVMSLTSYRTVPPREVRRQGGQRVGAHGAVPASWAVTLLEVFFLTLGVDGGPPKLFRESSRIDRPMGRHISSSTASMSPVSSGRWKDSAENSSSPRPSNVSRLRRQFRQPLEIHLLDLRAVAQVRSRRSAGSLAIAAPAPGNGSTSLIGH